MAYNTFVHYISCSTSTKEEIERVQAVKRALEDAELQAALSGHLEEYNLDDGQTKIRNTFRSIEDIEKAIQALDRRLNRLQAKCTGSRYSLQDGRVITKRRY